MRSNGTLYFLLGDHLGSTSLVTLANGVVASETRYKPWGEARYSSAYTPTNYTFTGQYSYASDFGLMLHNARWYDPYLSRFAQADTITPGGVQGLDRYAYVNNSPIRYTDPSGHRSCDDEDENGNCIDLKTSIKNNLESNYDIKITGGWDEDELLQLQIVLNNTSAYLGGTDNLNQAIHASLEADDLDQDYLIFHNTSGYCYEKSYNCYSSNAGIITISDGTFTSSYQTRKYRPKGLGLNTTNMGIEVSIAHEIGHMLYAANPSSLRKYVRSISNPYALSSGNGLEENMTNAIAYYLVSGGSRTSYRYQSHLDFAASAASLWNYSP
jgi:RHS repeat-associated protein